jgi:perosamine synthetase
MGDRFYPVAKPSLTGNELRYVSEAVTSGWISSGGRYVEEFERGFAEFCGVTHAVATCNGTAALHLAVLVAGIQAGDEVIMPDFTYVATANAVRYVGATPIFVDIDPLTLCIDPQRIASAITRRTKAIIPVHIYGHPANMPEIVELARTNELVVIEDAAEAHGARIRGKRVGGFGDMGVFSLFGNKIITTGEGGMLVTDDTESFERAVHLRDQAMSTTRRYWHTELGFNYRMTNLQAAVGVAQLECAGERIGQKKNVFELYRRCLGGDSRLKLNHQAPWAENVYWMVSVELLNADRAGRDAFIENLKHRGIDSRPFFYPCSRLPMYESSRRQTPVTERASSQGVNLPSYVDLTDTDIEFICSAVRDLAP